VLASLLVRSLYLRNVPDEVVERLERLATRHGMSVSALALRELTEASCRADNPHLLAALPDHDIPPRDLVADLEVERSAR
jgi:plasmid stability protein